MYCIFSVNEQCEKMMGFVTDDGDNVTHFETLDEAKQWCNNDPFAPSKTRYIFDMDMREVVEEC